MKRNQLPAGIMNLFLLSILSFNYLQSYALTADKFIETQRLTDRVMLVKMGYDVISAVEGDGGIVVIDAGISNSLTAKYRKIIEKEFNRNDFAYLINTHSHWDHIGGNQVFSDAVIVGHQNCPIEISERWKDLEKKKADACKMIENYKMKLKSNDFNTLDKADFRMQKIRYESVYNDLLNDRVVTPPNVTFDDQLTLFMGDLTLNLIYFGKAHSGSDIIIHIPEEKLLFIGDLFSEGGRPHFREYTKQDTDRWMTVKQWIEKRLDKIQIVIGGHGEIMGIADLKSFLEYIEKKQAELK